MSPTKITNFNRDQDQLELFWIYCILVAGKNSDWAITKVYELVDDRQQGTPLDHLAYHPDGLHNVLVANRVGQYGRIERALTESVELHLPTATVDNLEAVFGVGPKTARFFILHSRHDARVAVLDTHILKWLGEVCSDMDCPKATPANKRKYLHWEAMWLRLTDSYYPDVDKATVDLMQWVKYSGRELDMALPVHWEEAA